MEHTKMLEYFMVKKLKQKYVIFDNFKYEKYSGRC